jgi:hypothetical protein
LKWSSPGPLQRREGGALVPAQRVEIGWEEGKKRKEREDRASLRNSGWQERGFWVPRGGGSTISLFAVPPLGKKERKKGPFTV